MQTVFEALEIPEDEFVDEDDDDWAEFNEDGEPDGFYDEEEEYEYTNEEDEEWEWMFEDLLDELREKNIGAEQGLKMIKEFEDLRYNRPKLEHFQIYNWWVYDGSHSFFDLYDL